MSIKRRKAKIIRIGRVCIGGNNPVAVQSMAKTKTTGIESTIRQIKELEKAGCEIVRLAIEDDRDARALRKIKENTKVPLVADIHFHGRLALLAIDNGADKIRLNPGNIYRKEEVRQIARAAKLGRIPIRVGLNSGSLPDRKNQRQGAKNIADRMVQAALDYIKILEGVNFTDIVVSLKASNILDTIEAYRKISRLCDYPLHLGVTATGTPYLGAIKSSIAVGNLLLEGIGDTIRISLTDHPRQEVRVAQAILEALGLRRFGPEIISCPTCGRCSVDLIKIVGDLEKRLSAIDQRLLSRPIKMAVMGCVVNGPGEASEADIGVAFGERCGLLFKKGKPVGKVTYRDCIRELLKIGNLKS